MSPSLETPEAARADRSDVAAPAGPGGTLGEFGIDVGDTLSDPSVRDTRVESVLVGRPADAVEEGIAVGVHALRRDDVRRCFVVEVEGSSPTS